MEIAIRHMKPEEENEVRNLGRKAFGGFERISLCQALVENDCLYGIKYYIAY